MALKFNKQTGEWEDAKDVKGGCAIILVIIIIVVMVFLGIKGC